jgi:hypothetical protein
MREMTKQTVENRPQTTKKKTGESQAQTTRGDIEGFDRSIWKFMEKQLHITEADIFRMNHAQIPARVSGLAATLIRFFDPDVAKAKGLTINDYVSLSEHPELIIYEGYRVRGKNGEIVVKKLDNTTPSLLEEKIKKGEITGVGVIIPKTGAQKWLGRFGNFLMMGGFLLILILGVAIAIGISMLFK